MAYRVDGYRGIAWYRARKTRDGVRFVHHNGFLATVDTWDRALELLPQCLMPVEDELLPMVGELKTVIHDWPVQELGNPKKMYAQMRRALRLCNQLMNRLHQLGICSKVVDTQLDLQILADAWESGGDPHMYERLLDVQKDQLVQLDQLEEQIKQKESNEVQN